MKKHLIELLFYADNCIINSLETGPSADLIEK